MVDYQYVLKGLRGLARSGRVGAMAGHLGAAVVAGYLFGEDHVDLPDEVHAGIQGELERILRGEEAFWYNQKQAGVTIPELFEPFPEEEPQEDEIDTAMLTHRVKTLYGFFTLTRFVEDEGKRKKAEEQFRYLMA